MSQKTGWLEKWKDERMVFMVEIDFHRAGISKTPRKKMFNTSAPVKQGTDYFYVLDRKTNLGQLCVTAEGGFTHGDYLVVDFNVTRYRSRLRLLGKITKTTAFMEHKRVIFRGDIHFAAVNKEDYDRIRAAAAESGVK